MRWQTITVFTLFLLFFTVATGRAACDRIAIVRSQAPVYDRAPSFSSAQGWKTGNRVAMLEPGSRVRICEQIEVGLFFNKKRWYEIIFGENQRGWIYAGYLEMASIQSHPAFYQALLGPSPAYAADDLPDAGLPSFGRTALLLASFVCVLLGMVAKVAHDALSNARPDQPLGKVIGLRRLVLPLILAPMVFAGFLQFGDMTIPSRGGEKAVVVFLIMAFQNGFFWQTFFPDRRQGQIRQTPTT